MKNLSKKRNSRRRKPKLPLVSVVMPVYNAESYLPSAIESILNQTYKRFELIIVDDASTDGSLAIAKKYKRAHRSKITIIENVKNMNRGGDVCANLGIEKASGKYIARMDADDIAAPTRLFKQVEFLEKNKRVFLVGSSAHVIDKKGRVIGEKLEPIRPHDIYAAYATFHPIIHPSVMLRRIFYGKKFFYQIQYSANNDYYTFFKLICHGAIFVNLPEKLLFYRIHDTNDTFVNIKEKFLNTIKIRIAMTLNGGYKPTARDIGINIAQSIVFALLPQAKLKQLYLLTRGIIQPKRASLPIYKRLASLSV